MSIQLPNYEIQNMYISASLYKKGFYISSKNHKVITVYESPAVALLNGDVDADLTHFSSKSFNFLDSTTITIEMREKLYTWAVDKELIFYEDYFCFIYEEFGIEKEWIIRTSEAHYDFSPIINLKKFARVNKAFPTPKFVAESHHVLSNRENVESLFHSILFEFAIANGYLGVWCGDYGEISKIDVRTPALNLTYL